jgi:hypothetical protein
VATVVARFPGRQARGTPPGRSIPIRSLGFAEARIPGASIPEAGRWRGRAAASSEWLLSPSRSRGFAEARIPGASIPEDGHCRSRPQRAHIGWNHPRLRPLLNESQTRVTPVTAGISQSRTEARACGDSCFGNVLRRPDPRVRDLRTRVAACRGSRALPRPHPSRLPNRLTDDGPQCARYGYRVSSAPRAAMMSEQARGGFQLSCDLTCVPDIRKGDSSCARTIHASPKDYRRARRPLTTQGAPLWRSAVQIHKRIAKMIFRRWPSASAPRVNTAVHSVKPTFKRSISRFRIRSRMASAHRTDASARHAAATVSSLWLRSTRPRLRLTRSSSGACCLPISCSTSGGVIGVRILRWYSKRPRKPVTDCRSPRIRPADV